MEKKTCTKCNEEKPLTEFNFRNEKLGKLLTKCKTCMREYATNYYQKNKVSELKRIKAHSIKSREKLRELVYKYLEENPCVDCGETDPIVLDFDHVRGTKVKSISVMVFRQYGVDTIMEEIKKCDVRCANCHRRKTAKENNHYRFVRSKT